MSLTHIRYVRSRWLSEPPPCTEGFGIESPIYDTYNIVDLSAPYISNGLYIDVLVSVPEPTGSIGAKAATGATKGRRLEWMYQSLIASDVRRSEAITVLYTGSREFYYLLNECWWCMCPLSLIHIWGCKTERDMKLAHDEFARISRYR